jgi:hypothetical protein
MAPGTKPVGTVVGVEVATPGVTSPGLEKYLPGADAYIRAKYPAVDGLDGLFSGYVSGLKYADLNRRGFLELTVNKDQAVGTFQFLDGVNPLSGLPQWASEAVVAASDLKLSLVPEAAPVVNWQPGWRELDLVFGMAVDATGAQTQLDPAAYATLPRAGVQLADVTLFPQTLINVKLRPGQDWKANARLPAEVAAVEAELRDHGRVLIRPSGTEPKIKFYVSVRCAPDRIATDAAYAAEEAALRDRAARLVAALA